MENTTNNNGFESAFAAMLSAFSPEQVKAFMDMALLQAAKPAVGVVAPVSAEPKLVPQVTESYSAPVAPTSVPQSTPAPVAGEPIQYQEKKMNYTNMSESELEAARIKAAEMFKSFNHDSCTTADGGFAAWNRGPAGGYTMCYVSPFALEKIAKGERPGVSPFEMTEMAGEYNIHSMQKVILDTITGELAIYKQNLHAYPHNDGKYSDRAGYARIKRGKLIDWNDSEIIINKPVSGHAVDGDNGTKVVVYSESDWGTKTGWVVLKSMMGDDKAFNCGRVVVEPSTAECWTPKTDASGNVKQYKNRWGKVVCEMRKTKKGEDMDICRRHEYIDLIAQGNVIFVTDWFNHVIKGQHIDENGKGEMEVFISKVSMDKTFLRLRKNEISQAYTEKTVFFNRLQKNLADPNLPQVADEKIDQNTGEVTRVVIRNIFDKNNVAIELTRSELAKAGKFVHLRNGKPALGGTIFTMTDRIVDAIIGDLNTSPAIGLRLLDI